MRKGSPKDDKDADRKDNIEVAIEKSRTKNIKKLKTIEELLEGRR